MDLGTFPTCSTFVRIKMGIVGYGRNLKLDQGDSMKLLEDLRNDVTVFPHCKLT